MDQHNDKMATHIFSRRCQPMSVRSQRTRMMASIWARFV